MKADVENVVFCEVYPIYGAVDIRNSSAQRNSAIQKDHIRQLEILLGTLKELRKQTENAL